MNYREWLIERTLGRETFEGYTFDEVVNFIESYDKEAEVYIDNLEAALKQIAFLKLTIIETKNIALKILNENRSKV
jgi:cell division septum initiation protein DivIVA